MSMFDFFKNVVATKDGLILFILTLTMWLMIFDFVLGTYAAKRNPDIEFVSKKGIDGLIRKMFSVFLMVTLIPLSALLPNDTGVAFVYVTYLGYLSFELKSIIENFAKLGLDATSLKALLDKLTNLNGKGE